MQHVQIRLRTSLKYFSISLCAAWYTRSLSWFCSISMRSSPPSSSTNRLSFSVSPSFPAAWNLRFLLKTLHNLAFYTSKTHIEPFFSHHEDVVDGIQYDQNDFSIFDTKQVDDCLQSTALHQSDHLLHSATTGEVRHCPHCLPLCLEVSLGRRKMIQAAHDWAVIGQQHARQTGKRTLFLRIWDSFSPAESLEMLCSLSIPDLLTFLSCSTRGGSRPQVMTCWICLQGPAAMLDKAQAASFCTLAFGCLISWGRTFRTPASTAICVCKSEPLTMFPMERRAGVWGSDKSTSINWQCLSFCYGGMNDPKTIPWRWAPRGSWAPPILGRCQFLRRRQCGHCHHLRDTRLPSRHQTRCPYQWDGAVGSEREAPDEQGTAHETSFWA